MQPEEGAPSAPDNKNIKLASKPTQRLRTTGNRTGRRASDSTKYNVRKYLILHIMMHHREAIALTPEYIAKWWWLHAPASAREGTTFELEWFRFRRACARMAKPPLTKYGEVVKPYLRKWPSRVCNGCSLPVRFCRAGKVCDPSPGSVMRPAYMMTKKGARVRRQIARGSIAGYPEYADTFPKNRRPDRK